jgi:hypothetical protein
MKKITMQEFANIFDVFVAKDKEGKIYSYDGKPYRSDEIWLGGESYVSIITDYISDAEEHDYTLLVSPQEKTFAETLVSKTDTKNEEITVIEVLKDISTTLDYIHERLCK